MERRNFISLSCKSCMTIAFAGSVSTFLESCGGASAIYKTELKNDRLQIPVSQFQPNQNYLLVRNSEMEYDIALIKNQETYKAFYLQCTHENQPLSVNDKNIRCSSHGSIFSYDGKVLNGPADRPLLEYLTTIENGFITIKTKV
jgi:cytochrome b6-f complex iron-sulfur subunit